MGSIYHSKTVTRRRLLSAISGTCMYSVLRENLESASGGEILWTAETNESIHSSPTVVDGTVYVGSSDNNVYALDSSTGEELWRFDTDGAVRSSPTVLNGTVFVGSYDNNLYALDSSTGEKKWDFSTGGEVLSSPTVAGGTVFVGSRNDSRRGNNIYAVDAESGAQMWAFQDNSVEINSSPSVIDGIVYIGSTDSQLHAIDAVTGEEEWSFRVGPWDGGSINSSPTVIDGTVYVGGSSGSLHARDATTGDFQWEFGSVSGVFVSIKSSPTVSDNTVFFNSSNNDLYALHTDSGNEKWETSVGPSLQASPIMMSSPTVVDETVFVGSTDNNLYAVDAESGEINWRVETFGRITSSPTVVDGVVYIGSRDGSLYALDAGVEGSSGGSRVRLGTLGHHEDQPDRVTAPSPAFFNVAIEETIEPVAGEGLEVIVTVENTGDVRGRQQLNMNVSGLGDDTVPVLLQGGSSTTATFSVTTDEDDVGDHTAVIESEEDTDETTVTVLEPAIVTIDIQEVSEQPAGEALEVAVAVENIGDVSTEQTVSASISDLGTESTTVSLDSGESTIETLLIPTDEDDVGEYTLTIETEDHEVSELISITEPESADEDSASAQSEDENTVSDDDSGAASSDDSDTTNGDDSGTSSGDGSSIGLGTTEMAVAGGGGLVLLFGAYVLAQRIGDNDSSNETLYQQSASAGSGTSSRESTTGSVSASTSTNVDKIGGRPEQVKDKLDHTEDLLNDAATALDAGNYDSTLQTLDKVAETLKEVKDTTKAHDLGVRNERLSALQRRHDRYQERAKTKRAAVNKVMNTFDEIKASLETAANALDSGNRTKARGNLDAAESSLDTAQKTITEHELTGLTDRFSSLESKLERLRNRVAQSDIGYQPETIPSVQSVSLSYHEIEKGEPLGHGGTADVYYGTADTADGKIELALKEPRLEGTLHTEMIQRMLKEAENWQKIDDHDHIVSVIDYGEDPLPWIAMEYLDAGHLGKRAGKMEFEQALWTAIATTEAVKYAHTPGVVHLDLKPQNILLQSVDNAWDVPKVADWGLSRHLLDHSKSVEGMSPHYAAPEQFDGDRYGETDHVTDIYQLGAVFYELFTGRPPFEGKPFEVMNQIQHDTPTPPSEIANIPADLDEILMTALAKEKSDRYETVVYLRDELQQLR